MVRYLFYTIGDLTYQSPLVRDGVTRTECGTNHICGIVVVGALKPKRGCVGYSAGVNYTSGNPFVSSSPEVSTNRA